MEASIVDLRYRMKDVLRALERNEVVTVLHRGTVKGTIVPAGARKQIRAKDHPFFASIKDSSKTVAEEVDDLERDDSVIFDTDIFIWVQRGNSKVADAIDKTDRRCISVFSYMEFLQGSQDRQQLQLNQDFLRDLDFETLPLTENIGHRASIYVEQYVLSHNMRAGDAIIAATAAEHGLPLVTTNAKHYRQIPEIKLKIIAL